MHQMPSMPVDIVPDYLLKRIDVDGGSWLFVLTTVTVLALPVNLVAGLFGMNVGGIPLSTHPYGFGTIVVALVLLTALLAWFAFGRRD